MKLRSNKNNLSLFLDHQCRPSLQRPSWKINLLQSSFSDLPSFKIVRLNRSHHLNLALKAGRVGLDLWNRKPWRSKLPKLRSKLTSPPSPSTFRTQTEVAPEPMSFGNTAAKTTTSPPSSQGQRGDRGSGGRRQGRANWTGKNKQAPLFQQAETTTPRNDDRLVASSSSIIAAQESKGSLIDRIHSSDSPPSGSNPPPASHLPPRPNVPRTMSLKERMDGEKRKKECKKRCKEMNLGISVGFIVMGSS